MQNRRGWSGGDGGGQNCWGKVTERVVVLPVPARPFVLPANLAPKIFVMSVLTHFKPLGILVSKEEVLNNSS